MLLNITTVNFGENTKINSLKAISKENGQTKCKIWCGFTALLAQSFWMQQPHSAGAHSKASTAPTD